MEAHGHIDSPEPFLWQNARMPVKKEGGDQARYRCGEDSASSRSGLHRPFLKWESSGEGPMPGWGIFSTALASSHLKASGPLDLGCKGGWSEGASG